MDLTSEPARQVMRRARAVPPGRVTTYADLWPPAPRYAGAVMSACADPGVPWQRIVRADGSLAKGKRQRRLLESEGVPIERGRVVMREAWIEVE